jgi:hypothetical protein
LDCPAAGSISKHKPAPNNDKREAFIMAPKTKREGFTRKTGGPPRFLQLASIHRITRSELMGKNLTFGYLIRIGQTMQDG